MTEIRAHLIISGRVQGVGFRNAARKKAKKIGVNCWAKNLADTTVEIEVEGPEDSVYEFINKIKKNSNPFAKVKNIDISINEDLKGYKTFKTA